MPDMYTATWVSHSSIADFLRCPRAYFLNNIYKDPQTGHKIQLMSPALALGQAVHEALESLSVLPVASRFDIPLADRFEKSWKKISGERGGFTSESQEAEYKHRGSQMIARVAKNPGPLERLAVKIKTDLPKYFLSEEENIMLCGKVDWLEYLLKEDAVHIIDFKTGKREEADDSLQLPIYHLLVHNTQERKVARASYWYLHHSDELTEKELPDLVEAHEKVLTIAKKIKTQKKLQVFTCPNGDSGCRSCTPLEQIVAGEATFVGESNYRQDVYILKESRSDSGSDIL
ncbi:MAG: PD-(D/E)XK nuclease family protein [Patescibacteria group bacterium]